MQAKLIFVSVLLATFDFIRASNNMSDDSSSENESLTTNEQSSLGKHIYPDTNSPRTLTSSMKRARTSPDTLVRPRISFHPDVIAESTYPINGMEAEEKYCRALYKGKFILADEMRKQGLMLSGSNTSYLFVNSLLRNEGDLTKLLNILIRTQPQVFSQEYQCGRTIFQHATQANVDYILSRFKYAYGVRLMIFREALRNPLLRLNNEFYRTIRANRAWKMLELAEFSGRIDLISKCRFSTGSLVYYNLAGETLFTEAVKAKNLSRIDWLILRHDAIEFMLFENANGQNCIDLAIELFDKGTDPDYSVMRRLFQVISASYRSNAVEKVEDVLKEFIQHITEADENSILINPLKQELESAKAFALENNIEGLADDFVDFIDDQYAELLKIEEADGDLNSDDESSTEVDENEETVDNQEENDSDLESI